MKKYIAYAKIFYEKERTLSAEAQEYLSQAYAALRKKGEDPLLKPVKKLPITVRTLETLIRIGTAHCKLRLDKAVSVVDIQQAFKLLNFCIFDEDDERAEVKAAELARGE